MTYRGATPSPVSTLSSQNHLWEVFDVWGLPLGHVTAPTWFKARELAQLGYIDVGDVRLVR